MLPFCSPPVNETTDDWKKWEPKDLVIRDICPAWLLPSDHVLGRCIPKPSNCKILSKSNIYLSNKCFTFLPLFFNYTNISTSTIPISILKFSVQNDYKRQMKSSLFFKCPSMPKTRRTRKQFLRKPYMTLCPCLELC